MAQQRKQSRFPIPGKVFGMPLAYSSHEKMSDNEHGARRKDKGVKSMTIDAATVVENQQIEMRFNDEDTFIACNDAYHSFSDDHKKAWMSCRFTFKAHKSVSMENCQKMLTNLSEDMMKRIEETYSTHCNGAGR